MLLSSSSWNPTAELLRLIAQFQVPLSLGLGFSGLGLWVWGLGFTLVWPYKPALNPRNTLGKTGLINPKARLVSRTPDGLAFRSAPDRYDLGPVWRGRDQTGLLKRVYGFPGPEETYLFRVPYYDFLI